MTVRRRPASRPRNPAPSFPPIADLTPAVLIQAARKINQEGKMLAPVIDDAHLMEVECLRKLRLLLEDFPKNHNLNYAITGHRCGEIIIKDHYWTCPGTDLAGNAIDFLMRVRGATFQEAMQHLTQPTRS